ncbi:DUF917 domain-containing protein [Pediococcus inopinatus]|uniref:DUF917 domain-containing protein n=1 Tax=Pediococcus inopinatus TaxID=114090 RepID=UPI002B263D04|nr:DUF917 domain-containing protein [Pediococcus inopinatus]WPC18301.1 DUF917 domain-containing protein [Pediococcus inopinatus]
MRLLSKSNIENIAIGASLLGAGGGGDPYVGKMMALSAVEQYGPVKLLSVDEVKDEDIYMPAASMGAPLVMTEKFPKGDEFTRAFNRLGNYLGKEIKGTFPMEAGGVNSMIPILVAAQSGLPLIDCDGMGRAFPELQMTTFHLGGVSAAPMVVTDEKGNLSIIETVSDKWAELLARDQVVEMGASASVSLYPSTGRQIKDNGIQGIISKCERIGEIVKQHDRGKDWQLQQIHALTESQHLFDGKIIDISRETRDGFNYGQMTVQGLNDYVDQKMIIEFQNENLIAKRDGKVIASVPDLICLADMDNLLPSTSESIKYGKRIAVLGLPADDKWRTAKGIETVGPKYFGYDFDYQSIEELTKEG